MTLPQPVPFAPEGPQPLVCTIAPGEVYPVAALGPLRGAVEAVQGIVMAPVALPAQSALSTASLAVQGFANVETLGGISPTSLYCLTIARSGERKSASVSPFMAALHEHEKQQTYESIEAFSRWTNATAIWKGDRDRILAEAKKRKGENRTAAQADLDALGPEPTAPLSQERTVTEPTFEGLTRLFVTGQPSLGIFSDEGGQFLGGHAMNSDNRQKTLAALNDLWHANPIRRTRAGDGQITLYGRRLAIHLMVQPSVALAFMADGQTSDTGFLPRFLICEPSSVIGTRMHALSRQDDGSLSEFNFRMSKILQTPLPIDDRTRELKPRTLALASDARTLLIRFYDEIERAQGRGGDLAHVTGYASKAAEQAARIAGVFSLWRDLDAQQVVAHDMADAIELAQYYLSEAARLGDVAQVSAETDKAEKLRTWLLERWEHDDIITREVVQSGPNVLRETKAARASLAILEGHGWLVPLETETIIRGRARKEAWRIVRQRDVV